MKRLALVLIVGFALAGCGGGSAPQKEEAAETGEDDDFETPLDRMEKTEFHVEPEVNTYFARTPFHAEFTAEATNVQGKVTYRWEFGDGTQGSDEQNPKHVFEKPGLFTVTVRGKDEGGHEDGGALIVRALTKEQADAMQADYDRKGIEFKVP